MTSTLKIKPIETLVETAPEYVTQQIMSVTYRKGEYIFKHEDRPKYVWLFSEGVYDFIIYKKDGTQYLDRHGFVCPFSGCMEAISNMPSYFCSLRVVSVCKGYRLPKETFLLWLNESEPLKATLIMYWSSILCSRVYNPYSPVSRNLNVTLSGFLLQQCTLSVRQGNRYVISLTRSLLAEKLDVSKRTIFRLLSAFEEKELLSREGKNIVITVEQYTRLNEYFESLE